MERALDPAYGARGAEAETTATRSLTLLGSDKRCSAAGVMTSAMVEHRDQLEAEERLDAREHHAALLQQVTRRRIERDVFRGAFAGGLRDCHLTRLASHARGR